MINQYLADDTVASLLQIMDYVGSLESSRDLQPIHTKSFINRPHLVLYVYVPIFDVMFFLRLRDLRVKI